MALPIFINFDSLVPELLEGVDSRYNVDPPSFGATVMEGNSVIR